MRQPPLALPELSRQQRHSYLILRLLIAGTPLTAGDCGFSSSDAEAFDAAEVTALAASLQRLGQLHLHTLPGHYYSLEGAALHQRICFFSHLRRLVRQRPEWVTEDIMPRLEQRLAEQQPQLAALSELRLSEYLPRFLSEPPHNREIAQQQRLLVLVTLFSLISGQPVTFTPLQRQWLREKTGYLEASKITEYCRQQGAARQYLSDDETLFRVLVFALMVTPAVDRRITGQQQRIMLSALQLIRRFSQLSGQSLRRAPLLRARLFCHLSVALERRYFAVGLEDAHIDELIARYPAMVRVTSQALVSLEQQYAVNFSPQETLLIALILVAGAMQSSGYQERQLVILTNNQPQREQETERCLREALLLPVTFIYQSLESFCKDGAPRGVALVISPYSVKLPLFSPPLIETELPLSEHHYHSIRQILR